MKSILTFLLAFILPVVVIVLLFKTNILAGFAGIIVYLFVILFTSREIIYKFLGNMRYAKRDIEGTVKWFKKAYELKNCTPRTKSIYGYLLLKTGKLEESVKVFDSISEINTSIDDKMYIRSNKALATWKKGNLDEAIKMLENVIEKFETTTIYGSLGYLYIESRDKDKALEFNKKAYEYNSSNAIILDNLGQSYYMNNDMDKALEIYKELISKNPEFPEAYYNYALVLESFGELEDAISYVKKALSYSFSFLSTVSKEEVEDKLKELEEKLQASNRG